MFYLEHLPKLVMMKKHYATILIIVLSLSLLTSGIAISMPSDTNIISIEITPIIEQSETSPKHFYINFTEQTLGTDLP